MISTSQIYAMVKRHAAHPEPANWLLFLIPASGRYIKARLGSIRLCSERTRERARRIIDDTPSRVCGIYPPDANLTYVLADVDHAERVLSELEEIE